MQIETNEKIDISEEIFRAYDIRGIYGQTLSPEDVFIIGQALGSEARSLKIKKIAIARDGRLSGPVLYQSLCDGLLASGCDVIDLGAIPTPVLYFATHILDTDSGVMLTGSHNPANHNGLKMVLGGKTLIDEEIKGLYKRIIDRDLIYGKGKVIKQDVLEQYITKLVSGISLSRKLKVVVDCGNGIAGIVAPKLLRMLDCDVIDQYCDVDGRFPHHHPDPSVPKNYEALIRTVKQTKADLGLAFDGDGDRLGVVTNEGEIIWPDRQLMLYAKDLLEHNPGATIIFDVKCTSHLPKIIKQFGGEPVISKTGHSFVKAKMAKIKALLAGEMSGHIFFKDRWYGFDDSFYTAARLLEIISMDDRDISAVFRDFPNSVNTPELKLAISDKRKFQFMEQFIDSVKFDDGEVSTIDGLRVDFENGWGLIRASNTTPYLILRFEADDEDSLESIQQRFRKKLLALDENLILPF